jgi:hypothetical protein
MYNMTLACTRLFACKCVFRDIDHLYVTRAYTRSSEFEVETAFTLTKFLNMFLTVVLNSKIFLKFSLIVAFVRV